MTIRFPLWLACALAGSTAAQEAPSPEPTPSDLRAALQAWIKEKSGTDAYEDVFVPYRNALLRTKAKEFGMAQVIEALDGYMQNFSEHAPGTMEQQVVDEASALLREFRGGGDSLEALLPWLLLLQKDDPSDPVPALCLFEAWGHDLLDRTEALAAGKRLQELLANDGAGRRLSSLNKVVFELAAVEPQARLASLSAWVGSLCIGTVERDQPLGPFALGRASMPEIENAYEAAMQNGDFAAAGKALRAMRVVEPLQLAPELILALAGQQKDTRAFELQYQSSGPEQAAAIDSRLARLGFARLADGRSVSSALSELAKTGRDSFAFFGSLLEREQQDARSKDRVAESSISEHTRKRNYWEREVVRLERNVQTARRDRKRAVENSLSEAREHLGKASASLTEAEQEKLRTQRHLNEVTGQLARLAESRRSFRLVR